MKSPRLVEELVDSVPLGFKLYQVIPYVDEIKKILEFPNASRLFELLGRSKDAFRLFPGDTRSRDFGEFTIEVGKFNWSIEHFVMSSLSLETTESLFGRCREVLKVPTALVDGVATGWRIELGGVQW